MSRVKVIAGNWKMNCNLAESQALITEIRGMIRDERMNDTEVILCPTYLALPSATKIVEGSTLKIGAQNCHHQDAGAYTGEVSATMLKHLGIEYVIIGHSERRQYQLETEELCSQKINAAHTNGLIAIYCIGETLQQRNEGNFWDVLENQLSAALKKTKSTAQNLIIAYEPVWAIGTGQTATSDQAQEVHAFIRNWLVSNFNSEMAAATRILYGGSMKPENAAELLAKPDIDGGLIGGASLKPRDFVNIFKAAK